MKYCRSVITHKRNIPTLRFGLVVFSLLVPVSVGCNSTSTTPSDKPTITSFTASPSSLPAGGGSVTLSWDVKDATSLSVDGGVGAVIGTSKAVSVTSSTIFTLTATNANGSATQSASVSVETGADTTPPTVLSVDPPDGATGVTSDAIIVISFSEKMDKAATQAAYQSADLPTSEVTFFWNDEGTVLEIESRNFLEYAAGNDPTIAAKRYAFGLSDVARDASGNPLAAFSSSFSTLKSISTRLPSVAEQDGHVYSDRIFDFDEHNLLVGDYNDNTGIRGFLSFDLTSLPERTDISTATLYVYKGRVFNAPYATLGSVSLARADYREGAGLLDYDRPVSNPRIFDTSSSPGSGWLKGDVTADVRVDFDNREANRNRTQYRLSFSVITDNDNLTDIVQFETAEHADFAPYIQINYFAP
jgi:hypothetical protein